MRYSEFRCKEVINVRDGCRYGHVNDFEFDEKTGKIHAILVPVRNRLFGLIISDEEYRIPWRKIICIGDDAILVDVCEDDYRHNHIDYDC